MQDWQNSGQAGSGQGQHNAWQSQYAFSEDSHRLENDQGWSRSAPGQHTYPQVSGESSFYSAPHQGQATLGNGHGSVSTLNSGSFAHGQDQFVLNDSFPSPGQTQSMPNLDHFTSDLYGQSGGIEQNATTRGYPQESFQYQGQTSSTFNGQVPQYSDPSVVSQHVSRNQQPLQQQRFETVPQTFSPVHGYSQAPQLQPPQGERAFSGSTHQYPTQQAAAQQKPLQASQAFPNTTQPDYQQPSPGGYQQQFRFVPQHMAYAQPTSPVGFQANALPQPTESKVQPQAASTASTTSQPLAHSPPAALPLPQSATPGAASALADASTKKRKRVVKREVEAEPTQVSAETSQFLNDDADDVVPTSSVEEQAELAQFFNRPAAARKSFLAIHGAPFLVSSGSTTVSHAKSYDRLAPMVAMPSRSGKKLIPELGYDLPCEIQGRFSDRYKPSANVAGKPEDREKEAKLLIDQYQREMKALGVRRPKYADYPFSYQEQLKADEAAKTKAQRKARKEEEEERKKPLRPEIRPKDPVEAAAWDVLGIVHIDPSATRTPALIASAVQSLGDFLIKLRAQMTRAKQDLDQATKDGRPAQDIEELKKVGELKKDMYVRACEAADEHGDDAVLENLGGHQKGMLSLVNLLIGCVKAADYSGKLPKAALRLMSNVSTTKKMVEATNLENVRKRFADKGDDEVKQLVTTIASRVKKESDSTNGASEAKKLSAASSATSAARQKSVKPGASTKMAGEGSSAKRPLDDETSDARPGKKVNVDGPSSSLSSKLGTSKPTAGSTLQSKLAPPKSRLASTSLAAKSRAAATPSQKPDAAKPAHAKLEGIAMTTPIEVDQPISSKSESKTARPETKTPKAEAAKAAPARSAASGSLSSIASLLDSINTPKADAQTSQKDTTKGDTPETPEQKALRMRKEARRNLRVRWKPESELTEVRVFHKEAAEDEDNMTKDAADDRSEGMMLKRGANFADEEEEDDDDDDELPYSPWTEPVLADLSRIPQEYRDKAYITRGGTQTFHTDEQKAMAEREQRELMAIYTDTADIPPTPKSPGREPEIPDSEVKTWRMPRDDPQYQEMQARWDEVQHHGPEAAAYFASKRLDAKNDPATKLNSLLGNISAPAPGAAAEPAPEHYNYNMTPPQQHAQLAGPHSATAQPTAYVPAAGHALSLLTSDQVRNWRDPDPFNATAPQTRRRYDYPDVGVQTVANAIEDIFELFKGLPFPPTQPPAWLAQDEERVREWWAGHQKDAAARAKKEAEDRARLEAEESMRKAAAAQSSAPNPQTQSHEDAWAAYYRQQQQQQEQYAQYMAYYQQMQGAQGQQSAQAPASGSGSGDQSSGIGDDQIQALLAQINQPQPQANSLGLNPKDQGYQQLMMLTQLQQQQQGSDDGGQKHHQQRASQHHGGLDYDDHDYEPNEHSYDHGGGDWDDGSRDRDRGGNWDRDYRGDRNEHEGQRHGSNKHDRHGKGRKGNAPGGATLPPHKPANKALIGTKPCVFWQQGKCARGDKCTFRHDN